MKNKRKNKLNLLNIVGLVGIGYMVRDRAMNRPYRRSYSSYTDRYYGRPSNNYPTLKQYFRQLMVNKLDMLFYGDYQHGRVNTSKPASYRRLGNAESYRHAPYNVKEIHYYARSYAMMALNNLLSSIDKYGSAMVADYYTYADSYISDHIYNIPPKYGFDDTLYGWTDRSGLELAMIRQTCEGHWVIDLPEAVPLRKPYSASVEEKLAGSRAT